MDENGSNPNVLIADDETTIADTLALILSSKGHQASAVCSGEQTIEASLRFMPDVLISDIVMGGMNGIEAAIAIRRICPDCRIILFSGQAATADLLARHPGGRQFEILLKPVHPQALLDRLKSVA